MSACSFQRSQEPESRSQEVVWKYRRGRETLVGRGSRVTQRCARADDGAILCVMLGRKPRRALPLTCHYPASCTTIEQRLGGLLAWQRVEFFGNQRLRPDLPPFSEPLITDYFNGRRLPSIRATLWRCITRGLLAPGFWLLTPLGNEQTLVPKKIPLFRRACGPYRITCE
jgi:hypothetical protein